MTRASGVPITPGIAEPKYRYKRQWKGLNLKKSSDTFKRLFFIRIDLLIARSDVTSSLQLKMAHYACKEEETKYLLQAMKDTNITTLLTASKTKNSGRNSQLFRFMLFNGNTYKRHCTLQKFGEILLLIWNNSDGKAATDSPRHPSLISPGPPLDELLWSCLHPLPPSTVSSLSKALLCGAPEAPADALGGGWGGGRGAVPVPPSDPGPQ